jgi:hypothetical protein
MPRWAMDGAHGPFGAESSRRPIRRSHWAPRRIGLISVIIEIKFPEPPGVLLRVLGILFWRG